MQRPPPNRTKLWLFGLFALMLASALFGLVELRGALHEYATSVKAMDEEVIAFEEMENSFHEQVQEWKDTLLRGREREALGRHWGAFLEREREVRAQAQALIAPLEEDETKELLRRFIAAHAQLGEQYRAALARFEQSGYDPAAGDAQVRGIDRAPERLLDQASARIAAKRAAVSAHVAQNAERAALLGQGALLLAGVLCLIGLLFA
jgi:methyl-accepting chemotaxis protein-1 (serine sensor receptor)